MSNTLRYFVRALTVSAVASIPVRAQSLFYPPDRYAFGTYSNAVGSFGLTCGSTNNVQPGVGPIGQSCSDNGASFGYFANNQAGLVRAAASVSGTNLSASQYGSWAAGGGARWGDRLTITSGAPSVLALTVAWDGTLDATVSDNTILAAQSQANAMWNFQAGIPGIGQLVYYNNSSTVSARDDHSLSQSATVNDVRTFYIPVVGVSSLDFAIYIAASSNTQTYIAQPGASFSRSAYADFASTGKLTGLSFQNAAGQDITSSVQYSFLNGTQIYAGSVIPEPSTWVLFSTGLLVLGCVARRRGARTGEVSES